MYFQAFSQMSNLLLSISAGCYILLELGIILMIRLPGKGICCQACEFCSWDPGSRKGEFENSMWSLTYK